MQSGLARVLIFVVMVMFGFSGSSHGAERHYEVRGIVRAPLSEEGKIVVEHEDVQGLMPSMTMPFKPLNPADAADFKAGDGVEFTLTLGDSGSTISKVRKIDPASVRLGVPEPRRPGASVKRVKEGDVWPPFSLVDQNGKAINQETFRGAFTLVDFIFTRCAVPDYCPLMTSNFSEIRSALAADADAGRLRMLSVSFDPKDTPDVLRQYAEAKKADWIFATGGLEEIDNITKAFAVRIEEEGGTYNHGLCTALIGPDGKILQIWRGNTWKPQEVIEAIRTALKTPQS